MTYYEQTLKFDPSPTKTTLCFKKVHRLVFTITKSDVDQFL